MERTFKINNNFYLAPISFTPILSSIVVSSSTKRDSERGVRMFQGLVDYDGDSDEEEEGGGSSAAADERDAKRPRLA